MKEMVHSMICSHLVLYNCVKGVQPQAIIPKLSRDIKKWVPRWPHLKTFIFVMTHSVGSVGCVQILYADWRLYEIMLIICAHISINLHAVILEHRSILFVHEVYFLHLLDKVQRTTLPTFPTLYVVHNYGGYIA